MSPYESGLISRALVVLDAAMSERDARTVPVQLALWVLRPYCSKLALDRLWDWCGLVNPTLPGDPRRGALEAVRRELGQRPSDCAVQP